MVVDGWAEIFAGFEYFEGQDQESISAFLGIFPDGFLLQGLHPGSEGVAILVEPYGAWLSLKPSGATEFRKRSDSCTLPSF